jgi:hypothetical protein
MSQNIRKKAEKTNRKNSIDGVMVSVLASSVVDLCFMVNIQWEDDDHDVRFVVDQHA